MRSPPRLAAGLLAVAVAVFCAGPATASADGSEPGDSTTDAAIDDEIDIDFQIDVVLGLVPDDELEAYYREVADDMQRQVQLCMNDAGFEYRVESVPGVVVGHSDMSPLEWAQLYGFGVWTAMDPDRNPNTATDNDPSANQELVETMNQSEANAWSTAQKRCSQDVADRASPALNPMVEQAPVDFGERVKSDPRVRAAEEAWRECMAAVGQPFQSQQDMSNHVYAVWNGDEELAELESLFYRSEAWTDDSVDHDRWQELVDEEVAIAVADATCTPALREARQDVERELRPELVAAWQTVDWDLVPSTDPDDWMDEGASFTSDAADGRPDGRPESAPDDTTGGDGSAPAPLDLSGGGASDTTEL